MYMNTGGAVLGMGAAPTSSLARRRLLAFGAFGDGEGGPDFNSVDDFTDFSDEDYAMFAQSASYESTGGSDTNSDGGIKIGDVLLPILKAGTDIATKLAAQELLQNSTYLRDAQGRLIVNPNGTPILANSSEGVRVAMAAKKAGVLGNNWVMPLAIGAGVLALVLLMKKR